MSELEEHIKRISEKQQKVLKRLTSLEKENTRLKQDLINVEKKAGEQAGQLEMLTQRIQVLKATKGAMTEEEKKTLDKRLRQYLKEIDKCITFLNE